MYIYIKELQQAPLEFNHKKDRFNYLGGLWCFEIDTQKLRDRLGSSLNCNPICIPFSKLQLQSIYTECELQANNYEHTYTHK